MDAKRKFREAVGNRDEGLSKAVKTKDRGEREVLEQVRRAYRGLARLLVRLIR